MSMVGVFQRWRWRRDWLETHTLRVCTYGYGVPLYE